LTMSDIFDLTNILLLAVAVAIFLRLRSVLGRRTGDEQPRLDRYATRDAAPQPAREGNVVPMPRAGPPPSGGQPPSQNVDDRLGALPENSRALGPLREIAKADQSFDASSFLKGAKIAYEAIVTAYARGDRDTLRNLLSREVFESFSSVIAERDSRGETNELSFIGITSADIVDANFADRIAHVTVRFVSELVTAVRDKAGNVIEGDIKAVRQVTDVWTFARDVSSPNPNWQLVATDSPEG
jgi:predicted lipid-binding transport protein (Tim44 family)